MDQSIRSKKFFFNFSFSKDLQAYSGPNVQCSGDKCTLVPSGEFAFPIIDDSDRKLAKQLGMIDPDEFDNKGLPLTARAVCFQFVYFDHHSSLSKVFFIGPDKKVKASLLYPATTGRNFE